MTKVSEIMISDLVCCSPDANLDEFKNIMQKYSCSKIPVVDKNRMIIGGVALCDLNSKVNSINECMSKKVRVVEIDSNVAEVLKIMIMENVEEVPVIDKQGHFCGMVTEKILLGQKSH